MAELTEYWNKVVHTGSYLDILFRLPIYVITIMHDVNLPVSMEMNLQHIMNHIGPKQPYRTGLYISIYNERHIYTHVSVYLLIAIS